jgi:phage shock protein E
MRNCLIGVLFLVCAGAGLPAAAQHAPVEKDAAETSATNLHDEMVTGSKLLVIDVREPKEFEAGHVPGAVNIPIDELAKMIGAMDVSKDTTVVTVCEHGGRSSRAAVELKKLGFKTTSFCRLDGWKEKGYKVESGDGKPRKTGGVYKFTCHHFCQADKETADLDEMCECACNKPFRECMRAE